MKISLSTIFGFLLGFGAFIFAVYDVTKSVTGVLLFGNAAAIAVVLGGTIASTMISYEGRYVRKALGTLMQVFVPTSVNAGSLFGTVEQVIKWGKVGARDGLLALESEFKQIDTKEDPFLAHCIQLFLAGYEKDNLKQKLNTFINKSYERNMVQALVRLYSAIWREMSPWSSFALARSCAISMATDPVSSAPSDSAAALAAAFSPSLVQEVMVLCSDAGMLNPQMGAA